MSKGGALLKSGAALIRFLEFLCAVLVLGIFSYFLAYLKHHHTHTPTWMKAVEGMAGAAVLYTAFAVILVCFVGGITLFAVLGLLLDILFCAAFIAIAVLTRGGAKACSAARSPLSNNRLRDCRFQKAVFAVAVAGALLFLLSAIMEILLRNHHKKEKQFGPSPSNNYTSGTGKKPPFWKRQRNTKTHDAELGAVGVGVVAAEEKHRHSSHPTYASNTPPQPAYANQHTAPKTDKVVYERAPYAEVHHGGVPHAVDPTDV